MYFNLSAIITLNLRYVKDIKIRQPFGFWLLIECIDDARGLASFFRIFFNIIALLSVA